MPVQWSAHPHRLLALRSAAVVLVAVAVFAWAAFGVLMRVSLDEPGPVLHVGYGGSAAWWSALSFAVAASISYALMTWLLTWAVRRAPNRHRGMTVTAAGTTWVAAGLGLAFVAVSMLLLVAVQPIRTSVPGVDGTVLITQDAFDGDSVVVWRKADRFTYVREPGPTTVDPRSGACAVRERGTDAVLTCGSTSQPLSAAPPSWRPR